jgi:dihydroxyacetone kinase-like predicted kinase
MTAKIATGASAVLAWLDGTVRLLGNHSDRLDAINIFPVADGDTGSNLYLTARTAHDAVSMLDADDLGELLGLAGRAGMESARGNSGTLLAVVFAGFAEPLRGHQRLTGQLIAAGLDRARVRSWSALSEPVPGTMLSIIAEAADAAAETVMHSRIEPTSRAAVVEVLDSVCAAALGAVIATESQLGPLATAHVVDAGAVGLLLTLDALRAAVTGEAFDDDRYAPLHGYGIQDPHITASARPETGVEVMCTIALSPLEAATLRAELDAVGDSVIMTAVNETDDGYRWRVHVHVPREEDALEAIGRAGEPVNVSVTDLCTHEG